MNWGSHKRERRVGKEAALLETEKPFFRGDKAAYLNGRRNPLRYGQILLTVCQLFMKTHTFDDCHTYLAEAQQF
jgi:hypothetical protein